MMHLTRAFQMNLCNSIHLCFWHGLELCTLVLFFVRVLGNTTILMRILQQVNGGWQRMTEETQTLLEV